MIDPAGQDQDQQLPGLQKWLHISPNAVGKDAASGISGSLSSVGKTIPWPLARVGSSATYSSAEFIYPAGRPDSWYPGLPCPEAQSLPPLARFLKPTIPALNRLPDFISESHIGPGEHLGIQPPGLKIANAVNAGIDAASRSAPRRLPTSCRTVRSTSLIFPEQSRLLEEVCQNSSCGNVGLQ